MRSHHNNGGDKPSGPHGSDKPSGPHGSDRPSGPHGSDKPTGPHGSDKPSGPHGSDRPSGPHGKPDGKPSHGMPMHPSLQHIVEGCADDVKKNCVNTSNVAQCFHENFSCFSSECVDAINGAVKEISAGGGMPPAGNPGGHPNHPPIPHEVMEACKEDKEKLCPNAKGEEAMKCMKEHAGEWSDGCKKAVSDWKATLPTGGPGGPGGHGPGDHGPGHPNHPPIPHEVIEACKEDKEKLCPNAKGEEAMKCMKEHTGEWSDGCKKAVSDWRASHPTNHPHPSIPASVIDACAADKLKFCANLEGREGMKCMREHYDEFSDVCTKAVNDWWTSMHSGKPKTSDSPGTNIPGTDGSTSFPGTIVQPSDVITVQPPSVEAPIALIDPPMATTSIPLCQSYSASGASVSAEAMSVVNMAYSPEQSASFMVGGEPRHHPHVGVYVGATIGGVLLVGLTVVAVKRYRSRLSALQQTSTPAPEAATVNRNPLAYNNLSEAPDSSASNSLP